MLSFNSDVTSPLLSLGYLMNYYREKLRGETTTIISQETMFYSIIISSMSSKQPAISHFTRRYILMIDHLGGYHLPHF
jgi:hypothetical protein